MPPVTADDFFGDDVHPIGGRIDTELFKMLQVIDSYHDFGKDRGNEQSKSAIDHFFIDLFVDVKGEGIAADKKRGIVIDYLKNNYNINYGNIEITTEQSYERRLDKDVLYGDPVLGTVHTNVTFSQLLSLSAANITKLANECDAIQLIDDPEFETVHNRRVGDLEIARKTLGLNFLSWMFHNISVKGTEVGVSYDADYEINKLVLSQLNNKEDMFVTKQVITPQNILDSAGTGLGGIYTSKKGLAHLAILQPTNESRINYIAPLAKEYANGLTKDKGNFNIVAKDTFVVNPLDFEWNFTPKIGGIVKFTVDAAHKDGPGAECLASLIACYGDSACLGRVTSAYSERINTTNVTTLMPDPVDLAKFFLDVKRMGDHEQANAVKALNLKDYRCIFSTCDRLSGLYSRILGNPTVFANTYKSSPHDDEPVSYGSAKALFCYRGIPIIPPNPAQIARKALINNLQQFNYVLTVFRQINYSKSSFQSLVDNIRMYKDSFVCAKFSTNESLQTLKTNLIRRKANDIYAHLSQIMGAFFPVRDLIAGHVTALDKLASEKGLVDGRLYDNNTKGFNIAIKDDTGEEILNQMNDDIEAAMNHPIDASGRTLLTLFHSVQNFLKDYKKTYTKIIRTGDAIQVFSIPKMLFINANKTESKVDYINYDIAEIDDIVTTAQRYFSPRGKITPESLRVDMESKLTRYYSRLFQEDTGAEVDRVKEAIKGTADGADIAASVALSITTPAAGGSRMRPTPPSITRTSNVRLGNTIEAVKANIQRQEGLPPDHERLIFSGAPAAESELVSIHRHVTDTAMGLIERFSDYLILVPGDDGQFPLKDEAQDGGVYTKISAGTYLADYTYWNQVDIVEYTLNMMMSLVQSATNPMFPDTAANVNNKLEYIWKDLMNQLELNGPIDRPDIRADSEDIRTEGWYIQVSTMSGRIAEILVKKPDDGTYIVQWLQSIPETAPSPVEKHKVLEAITRVRIENLKQLVGLIVNRIKEMEYIGRRDFAGELSELDTRLGLSINEITVYHPIPADILAVITPVHNYIVYKGDPRFAANLAKVISKSGGKRQKRRTYKKSRRTRQSRKCRR